MTKSLISLLFKFGFCETNIIRVLVELDMFFTGILCCNSTSAVVDSNW